LLGDYQLLEEIGRGGMGVVFRARQLALNREVAVKVLPGGRSASPTFVKRFQREAQAAASLNHPNIVRIHEIGEHEGELYFSMDLITGSSLAQLISGQRLPERQSAEILRAVAQAVGCAHAHQMLHRDLKPSNVLLDPYGVPHITDFGLVKRADDSSDLTLSGQIIGSPNYMAPEQADSELGPTTAASDVYSLGAILYHLLTGRPPVMAETVAQTLRLLAECDPAAPSLLDPGISRDLETICLRCLERSPSLRYCSAQAVADDLGRFLAGQAIYARPIGRGTKALRWCKRNLALAGSLGAIATLLLFLGIASPVALVRIHNEQLRGEAARKAEGSLRLRAQAGEKEARRQLYIALVQQAEAAVHSAQIGQRLDALEAVRRAAAISNSVELRGEALAALALSDLRFERRLALPPETTLAVLNPTFDTIALCRGSEAVELRSLPDLRLLASLSATTNLPAYLGWWSPDQRYFAVKRDLIPSGERADLEVWRVNKPQRPLFVLHNVAARAVSFDRQRNRLIAAQAERGVGVWDLEDGSPIARFAAIGTPSCLQFAPDGARFVSALPVAGGFSVTVVDAATGAQLVSHTFPDTIMDLAWHPWGRWIAIADQSGSVNLLDSQSGELRALGTHKAQAVTVTFSPDGDYLLSGGWEGELICWDMHTMQRALAIPRDGWTAQFNADGHRCVIFTPAAMQFYGVIRPTPRAFGGDLGPRLREANFSPDGRWLAASADTSLGVWDLGRLGPGSLLPGMGEARMVFTADGKEMVAANPAGKCLRWTVSSGGDLDPPSLKPVDTVASPLVTSVCAASNLLALTGSQGSALTTSGLGNGLNWLHSSDGVNRLSPDARWLGICMPYSPILHVYRLPALEPCGNVTARANIADFAFRPGAAEVAVSSRRGVEFWSMTSWTQIRLLTNFTGILFSPKSSNLWLTSDFRTAGLYNAATLELVLPLPAGTLPLVLSADGGLLAVSVDARYLKVWDLQALRRQLGDLGLRWD
jgi:WD40 repeat protein